MKFIKKIFGRKKNVDGILAKYRKTIEELEERAAEADQEATDIQDKIAELEDKEAKLLNEFSYALRMKAKFAAVFSESEANTSSNS